ncbi:MAG: SNF2-related protein [Candidatus Moduliflexus flocculans]|nr:SNF2-related protein [Candidatus Moduliflexus flocculans]
MAGAQVDLNPHQVDAALFAFKSPLSKGALLADEVGLGKTIEAGLVLSQKWAERKRRILVITPSNLRKQWYQELTEKFFLPCRILEIEVLQRGHQAGPVPALRSATDDRHLLLPVRQEQGGRCPCHRHGIWWSLTRPTACATSTSRPTSSPTRSSMALAGKDKLLLTATPLQNSLLELFGLVSFIDEHAFGDLKSFREQFANLESGPGVSRRSRRGSQPDLPPHPAPPGHRLHPVHQALAAGARSSPRRRAKTASTTSFPTTCSATISKPCRPASAP